MTHLKEWQVAFSCFAAWTSGKAYTCHINNTPMINGLALLFPEHQSSYLRRQFNQLSLNDQQEAILFVLRGKNIEEETNGN